MFGISLPELVVIFAVLLIVFGPEKLPEMARTLGKIMADLRRQSDHVRREFYNTVYEPAKDTIESTKRELVALKNEVTKFPDDKPTSALPPTPPTQKCEEPSCEEPHSSAPVTSGEKKPNE